MIHWFDVWNRKTLLTFTCFVSRLLLLTCCCQETQVKWVSDRLISSVPYTSQEKWKGEKKDMTRVKNERQGTRKESSSSFHFFSFCFSHPHNRGRLGKDFISVTCLWVWKRGNIHVTLIQYRRWTSDVSHEDMGGKRSQLRSDKNHDVPFE